MVSRLYRCWLYDVSNQPESGSHRSKRPQREIQVVPRVPCRELAPYACVSLGDDRVPEPRHEHSFLEQQVAHLDRLRRFAEDHRHDRGLTRQRFEAETHELFTEIACVLVQAAYPLR